MLFLYIGLGLLGLIVLVVMIKTLRFKPKHFPEMIKTHEFDEKHAVDSLSQMLQFKTISHSDPKKEDPKVFKAFRDFILERYPLIKEKSTYLEIERGMLFQQFST